MKILVSSLIVLLLLQHVAASRILAVVLTASYSHQMFYQQLWKELALRGHELVVITTDPTNETLPNNFKEINIHETYIPAKRIMDEMLASNVVQMVITNRLMELMLDVNEFTLHLPQVQELINNKSEHFDLVMVEHFANPGIGFKHRFDCPMIGVMSFDAMDVSHSAMGNAVHSMLYSLPVFNIDENSSVFLRVVAVVITGILNLGPYRNIERMDRISRDMFGQDTPSILELMEQTDMLFTNANPLFNAIRPFTPSTISLAGGIHMKAAKPLPKVIKTFLDNAKEGAIFFSLGSNVKSNELTMELRQTIMKTLGQLPYKVLWKYEDDSLVGKPDNVQLVKWAPQQDVLRHKNVKLFITQGGLQSLEETLYINVPVVVIPFAADQDSNAVKVHSRGLGLVIDKNNLTVEGFKSAIMEVITNPIYKETVKRLATQIQDTPMTALKRAVWWTEYVLRHKGAQHLKGPTIPWYQFYYFDVLSVIGSVCLVLLGITYIIGRFCVRKVCGLTNYCKTKPEKTKKLKRK